MEFRKKKVITIESRRQTNVNEDNFIAEGTL